MKEQIYVQRAGEDNENLPGLRFTNLSEGRIKAEIQGKIPKEYVMAAIRMICSGCPSAMHCLHIVNKQKLEVEGADCGKYDCRLATSFIPLNQLVD